MFLNKPYRVLIVAIVLLSSAALAGFTADVLRREIVRTTEKHLTVHLEIAFGSVSIGKGDRSKILEADFWDDDSSRRSSRVIYKLNDQRGDLKIETLESASFWRRSKSKDKGAREWNLRFSDAVPMEMQLELGAGEGTIDLTNLQIERLDISAGASSVDMTCDEPNRVVANRVSIESGVSKFEARNLCNLNFKRLSFEGGIGAYRLDFGGKLRHDAEVSVEVGLGAVTIIVPRETAVRLKYEDSWFSKFDLDDGFTRVRKGTYETENFEKASARLTIEIQAGLGSVRIRRSG
jgi:hypothetical protein